MGSAAAMLAFVFGFALGGAKGRIAYVWGPLGAIALSAWIGLTVGSPSSGGTGGILLDEDDSSDYDSSDTPEPSTGYRVGFGAIWLAMILVPGLVGIRRGINAQTSED